MAVRRRMSRLIASQLPDASKRSKLPAAEHIAQVLSTAKPGKATAASSGAHIRSKPRHLTRQRSSSKGSDTPLNEQTMIEEDRPKRNNPKVSEPNSDKAGEKGAETRERKRGRKPENALGGESPKTEMEKTRGRRSTEQDGLVKNGLGRDPVTPSRVLVTKPNNSESSLQKASKLQSQGKKGKQRRHNQNG